MAEITLNVTATNGAGVQASWIRIDDQDVVITNGAGSIQVDGDQLQQSYTYWFTGNSGSQFSFEIKQSGTSLKKVSDTIATGYNRGVGSGHFKLLSPIGLW